MSMPLKTFISTPTNPSNSNRCTAANDKDFQKPSTRSASAPLATSVIAVALRFVLDRRSGQNRLGVIHDIKARPLPTVLIGFGVGQFAIAATETVAASADSTMTRPSRA